MSFDSSPDLTSSITSQTRRAEFLAQIWLLRIESVMSSDESAFAFAIAKAIAVLVCGVSVVLSLALVGAKRIK